MLYYAFTNETWAYIQGQLDFAPYRQRKVHVISEDGGATLCGIQDRGGEWSDEPITSLEGEEYQCIRCVAKLRHIQFSQRSS